jgi:hypothetical protein
MKMLAATPRWKNPNLLPEEMTASDWSGGL